MCPKKAIALNKESYSCFVHSSPGSCWRSWSSRYPRYSGTKGGERKQGGTWTTRTSRTCCMLYNLDHIHSEGENPVTMESICLLPIPRPFMCPSREGKNPVTMVMATRVYVYYYCHFLLQGPQGGQGMRGDKGPTGASVSPRIWYRYHLQFSLLCNSCAIA